MKVETSPLIEWMKSISGVERAVLAQEIGASPLYLHQVASRHNASIKLARKIHYSNFNQELPRKRQFTYREMHDYYWEKGNAEAKEFARINAKAFKEARDQAEGSAA